MGKSKSPAFVSNAFDLSDGGLWVGGSAPRGQRLVIGPFESDDCVVLEPTRKGYREKYCLDY